MTPHLISKPGQAVLTKSLLLLVAATISLAPLVLAKSDSDSAATESEASTQASNASDFAIDEDKAHPVERKEIENLLTNLETVWNRHDLEAVMNNYADEYINNDGIDKGTVRKLTKEFWETYPDVHSTSSTKHIRVDGVYATVDSRDIATGTTAKEFQSIKSKGELQSLSEGQLYLKRIGTGWKIIGDRIDFEKVKVAFGLAKQLNASFTAPEQIKSGKSFTAKLEVSLPPGLNAVGSISNQPLKYPQVSGPDTPRVLESATLERVMNANIENCNELLTARVLLTNPTRDKVLGVQVFTRRLNVVPEMRPENVIGLSAAAKAELNKEAASASTSASENKDKAEQKKEAGEAKKEAAPGELPRSGGIGDVIKSRESVKETIKNKEEPGSEHPPDVVSPATPIKDK
ncbi:MAG: nuclear transport factor 2 family protein [Candidatus Obscuribacter sp.]|nr:nuclear transport factor 2 family protein [Candidatus Obscuribacter sp.]